MNEQAMIDRLLAAAGGGAPMESLPLSRLGIELKLTGLFSDKLNALREQCARSGKGGEGFDEELFNARLIVAATLSPHWGDERLMAKFKASGPEQVVRKILLAGEMARIIDKVMELSGFREDGDTVKNLSSTPGDSLECSI